MKEANNYTTKSNSTPLPTGKGVRLIISGGGTGGHIFPAISIANAIKELCPDAEILFVGAEGRMEMQRVPDAGYRIIGLPVAGSTATSVEELLRTAETDTKPVESTEHHQGVPPASSRRCRWLCQWSYAENGGHDGYSHADTGTEFLRRCHQQAAGTEGMQDLRGLRKAWKSSSRQKR